MAKIFLDANVFIDVIEQREHATLTALEGHQLFISPLSLHILLYVTKQKIPSQKMQNILQFFTLVPLDEDICTKALVGPTPDFEDNIQLFSSAQADCTIFLTRDQHLKSLTFFGKAQIGEKI